MKKHYIKQQRSLRRTRRVRSRIKQSGGLPRLSVFRSNRYIWAQVIDDQKGTTLASATSRGLSQTGRLELAREVGKIIAQDALKHDIKRVAFDRGAYQYHGQVKALAEGAREGGLQF